jgi:hypothetical protein
MAWYMADCGRRSLVSPNDANSLILVLLQHRNVVALSGLAADRFFFSSFSLLHLPVDLGLHRRLAPTNATHHQLVPKLAQHQCCLLLELLATEDGAQAILQPGPKAFSALELVEGGSAGRLNPLLLLLLIRRQLLGDALVALVAGLSDLVLSKVQRHFCGGAQGDVVVAVFVAAGVTLEAEGWYGVVKGRTTEVML